MGRGDDGIGGMGKTALALEVAHLARKQALFDAYLFVSAKTTWLSAEGVRDETLAPSLCLLSIASAGNLPRGWDRQTL